MRIDRLVPAGGTLLMMGLLWIGLTSVGALYYVADRALFSPLPVQSPHELFRVTRESERHSFPVFEFPVAIELLRHTSAAALSLAAAGEPSENVSVFEHGRLLGSGRSVVTFVTPHFFSVLRTAYPVGTTPEGVVGDTVVISHSMWVSAFGGTPDVIGRVVTLNDLDVRIAAVAPKGFDGIFPGRATMIWAALEAEPRVVRASQLPAYASWLTVFGRISGDVAQAQAQISSIVRSLPAIGPIAQASKGALSAKLTPASHGVREIDDRSGDVLPLLLGVSGALLASMAVGVGTLLVGRLVSEEREARIRLSLGATTRRIVGVEVRRIFIVVCVAGLGSIVARPISTNAILAYCSLPMTEAAGLDVIYDRDANVVVALACAAVASFLCGLVVMRWRSLDANPSGRPGLGLGTNQRFGFGILISLQMAVSLPLLVATFAMTSTITNIAQASPGFAPEGLFALRMPVGRGAIAIGNSNAVRKELMEKLAAIPGVRSASAASGDPLADLYSTTTVASSTGDLSVEDVRVTRVERNYFDLVGIQLRSGRALDSTAAGDREVWVSETLARRLWPEPERALGERVRVGSAGQLEGRVAGVVGEVQHRSFRDPLSPEIYLPLDTHPGPAFSIVVRLEESNAPGSLAAIREVVSQISHAETRDIDIASLAVEHYSLSETERVITAVAGAFASLSTLVMVMGLSGLLSLVTAARRSEVALRVALGASRRAAEWPVFRQVTPALAAGVACGAACTFLTLRWLESVLFNIQNADLVVVASSVLGVLVVALWIASAPVIRARRVSVARVLRGG